MRNKKEYIKTTVVWNPIDIYKYAKKIRGYGIQVNFPLQKVLKTEDEDVINTEFTLFLFELTNGIMEHLKKEHEKG